MNQHEARRLARWVGASWIQTCLEEGAAADALEARGYTWTETDLRTLEKALRTIVSRLEGPR